MPELSTIYDYMRANASLLGRRIFQEYPALHQFGDPVSARIEGLLRTPFPRKPSRSWGWPDAGRRREPAWWSPNAAPAKR